MASTNSIDLNNNNSQNVVDLYRDFWYYAEIPLKLLGITQFNATPPKGIKRMLLNFCYYFLNMLVITGITGEFIYVIVYPEEFKDSLTLIKFFAYISYSTLSQAKILKLFYNGADVEELVQQIQTLYPSEQEQRRKPYIARILQPHRQWTRRYIVNFYVVALISITLYSFANLLAAGITYLQQGPPFQRRLPFLIFLPFDTETTVSFSVGYIYESWAGIVCAKFQLACDALLFFVVQQLIIQFELIVAKLQDVRFQLKEEDCADNGSSDDESQNDNYFVEIIEQHQKILNMVDDINIIFEFSVFITFLSSITLICFVAFLTKVGNDYADLLKNSCFLVYEICQIWLISTLSSKLKASSLAVADAAYEQKWYYNNVRYQRSLCLIITRSQRAAVLKGYIFKEIDMESFLLIMANSYKFLAALNAMFD